MTRPTDPLWKQIGEGAWLELQELKALDTQAMLGHKARAGEAQPIGGVRCDCGCNQALGYRDDVVGIGPKTYIAGHQRE